MVIKVYLFPPSCPSIALYKFNSPFSKETSLQSYIWLGRCEYEDRDLKTDTTTTAMEDGRADAKSSLGSTYLFTITCFYRNQDA